MSNALEIVPSPALDHVTGGAGTGINLDVDVPKTLEVVGKGAQRLLGCATGAESWREFGNCILTGQLGNVPQSQSPSQDQQPRTSPQTTKPTNTKPTLAR